MEKKQFGMWVFFEKFWLKPWEFATLTQQEKSLVAKEYLKWVNPKKIPPSRKLDEIVNNMVWVLYF